MESIPILKKLNNIQYNISFKDKNEPFEKYFAGLSFISDNPTYEIVPPLDNNIYPYDNFNNNIENKLFFINNDTIKHSLRLYYSQWKGKNTNYIIQFSFDCKINEENIVFLKQINDIFNDNETKKSFSYKLIFSDFSNYFLTNLYSKVLKYETSIKQLIWSLLMYKYSKQTLQTIVEKVGFDVQRFKNIKRSRIELIYDFVEELHFSEYSQLLCVPFVLDNEIDSDLSSYLEANYAKHIGDVEISHIKKIFAGKSLLERFEEFSEQEVLDIKNSLDYLTKYRNAVMHCKLISYDNYIEMKEAIKNAYSFEFKMPSIYNKKSYRQLKDFFDKIAQQCSPIKNLLDNLTLQ